MNKNILLMLLFASLSTTLFAQPNTFPTSGNVGVGVLNPLNGIHVFSLNDPANGSLRFGHSGIAAAVLSFGWNGINDDAFKITKYPVNSFANPTDLLVVNSSNGNVGIGTSSPQHKLDINGAIQAYNRNSSTATWDNIQIWAEGENSHIESNGDENGLIIKSNLGNKILLLGNVGIGTMTPQEKLSVNGKIRAHEVKVEATNWPDYVFDPDYKILGLSELESYIKTNKHLPDIPSAKTIEIDGIGVGDMIKLQQKKIEELTLHLIEKDKQLSETKNELSGQKIKLLDIEQKYSQLNEMVLKLIKSKNDD